MKTSLLDIEKKSLTEEQIDDCLVKFEETINDFTRLPQVKYSGDTELKRLVLEFQSKSGHSSTPRVVIEQRESCRGFEKMLTVHIGAYDCGLCRSGGSVTLNATNFNKLDKVMDNVKQLFKENYELAMKEDKDQLEFSKVIDFCRQALHFNEHKEEYKTTLAGIKGDIFPDRQNKTFRVEFEDLSAEQVEKLGMMIDKL